jgi:hypothetical protein
MISPRLVLTRHASCATVLWYIRCYGGGVMDDGGGVMEMEICRTLECRIRSVKTGVLTLFDNRRPRNPCLLSVYVSCTFCLVMNDECLPSSCPAGLSSLSPVARHDRGEYSVLWTVDGRGRDYRPLISADSAMHSQ